MGTGGGASATHDRRRRRLAAFVRLRGERLGLGGLPALGEGGREPRPDAFPDLETLLRLPPGFLDELRAPDGPHGEAEPEAVLAAVEATEAPPDLADPPLPVCATCAVPTAALLRRHGYAFRVVLASDGPCLCDRESVGELDLFFRAAVHLAGIGSLVVLGGNADADAALRRLKRAKAHVVREDRRADPGVVRRADAVVIARGLVKHKTTLPYTAALTALPKDERPPTIYPDTPNANAIAEALVRHRAEIRAYARGRRG